MSNPTLFLSSSLASVSLCAPLALAMINFVKFIFDLCKFFFHSLVFFSTQFSILFLSWLALKWIMCAKRARMWRQSGTLSTYVGFQRCIILFFFSRNAFISEIWDVFHMFGSQLGFVLLCSQLYFFCWFSPLLHNGKSRSSKWKNKREDEWWVRKEENSTQGTVRWFCFLSSVFFYYLWLSKMKNFQVSTGHELVTLRASSIRISRQRRPAKILQISSVLCLYSSRARLIAVRFKSVKILQIPLLAPSVESISICFRFVGCFSFHTLCDVSHWHGIKSLVYIADAALYVSSLAVFPFKLIILFNLRFNS